MALSERGAAETPGHEVVASVETVVGTIASSASASTSIASVASIAPVAIVLPATSQQVLEESSKLWRSSGQGEPGKEESDRQLHVGVGQRGLR